MSGSASEASMISRVGKAFRDDGRDCPHPITGLSEMWFL